MISPNAFEGFKASYQPNPRLFSYVDQPKKSLFHNIIVGEMQEGQMRSHSHWTRGQSMPYHRPRFGR